MLEQELFELLSGTSDAAFALTDLFEICSWNKGAETLFGYSAVEALKKNCQSLLQGRGVLGIQAWGHDSGVGDSAAKHLDIPDFDLDVKIRSGRRIWVNVSTLLFENSRNRRRLIIHFARDITVRKKNEELLHKMMDISRQLASLPDVVSGPTPISPLSEREKNILRFFSSGKNAAQIARNLEITPQTLRNHLHHINQKLRTHNRLEAVTHATQRKLL
jgi:DNA-binding CsgD family transcriptional regulator